MEILVVAMAISLLVTNAVVAILFSYIRKTDAAIMRAHHRMDVLEESVWKRLGLSGTPEQQYREHVARVTSKAKLQ